MPTIRSRCHVLALRPLPDEQVAQVLTSTQPGLDASRHRARRAPCRRSSPRAFETLGLAEDSAASALLLWLENPAGAPTAAMLMLADALGSDPQGAEMSFAREILFDWLAGELRASAMQPGQRQRLASATELWDKANALLDEADSVNLDFKQTLGVIFDAIRKHVSHTQSAPTEPA